jgi:hypothetical protein
MTSTPGTPATEQISHGLTETVNFRYRPELQLFLSGGAGYTYEEARNSSMRGGSQNLGGGATWQYKRGRTTAMTSGTGQLAALETIGQPLTLGYMAGGSQSLTHARERGAVALTYTISYASNATGVGGSTLTQSGFGSADAAVGRSLQLRSTINYSQTRHTDPLLGEYQNHTLTFLARAALRRSRDFYSLDATLGESDGLSESVAPIGGAAPTPILSSAYNTRSKFATFQATQTVWRGKIAVIEMYRLMSVEMPLQPSQREESAMLSLRWALGQVFLSVEDRLSRGGTNGSTLAVNYFMLRLSRGFGARF